ncbi:tRNA (adenosine(37)-N6)-threonylcarbamoyltransferase complex dimerization subunit type 1 TsaB [Seohaeicola zhoushanensis]|uniref:tRNA N6-adenosine(37)-N6-threonylcarbamoyltransferase complex dimerization subunit TsaB n=1 Tax=Seohaeicola zhoushanensis TaxID=1569283 RepID=A0A8J3H1E4_9RHOB|nr:tRNA (adenosine(37)-N6)-threonylcarbamoyltransferase complex dimerization subunit type 1 TsaB [Seohaeicola zhoushanensis]GHF64040.1 tRNA N6-adenosine(37)-N6-threonylcarbamoyltransferase complex dimerization subunit TsaB [Seohaeicola zhoushanensis]
MSDSPAILAFDTSAAHCAAALLRGGRIQAARAEAMSKGQAERLMGLLEEVLAEGGTDWKGLDAIAVGIGPGNFTGIRISVSAARGLALGLGVPAYGIDGFAARREALGVTGAVGVPAPREQVYLSLSGAAAELVERPEDLPPEPDPQALAEAIARLAAVRWPAAAPAPAPLYIRPADAAPSSDRPPVLLD